MSEGEKTVGGPLGKVVGQVKQAASAVIGRADLQREGKLQEVQSEAQREAAEQTAEAEKRKREAEIEAERAETQAERHEVELPPRARRLVTEWPAVHQIELRDDWLRAREHQPLAAIEPLR